MKRIVFKITLLALLVFSCLIPVRAQQIGGTTADSKMIGASGGSNAGGMSNLYTPNLYDGSVTVNIPVYDFSTDAGQYGVSLSYNTKGVKVDEISSPAGLHWNLNAEGTIQRVVKGLPDELSITYWDTIWTSGVTKYNRFRGRLAGSFDAGAEITDPMVFRDKESDDFLVSVAGLSFTFNIGTGRAIYTNPNRNFTVDIQSAGQPYATVVQQTGTIPDPKTLEFLVTDLAGNKFHFRRGDYDRNQLSADMDAFISQGIVGDYDAITRWVVDTVSFANGKKISYTYYPQSGATDIYKAYATNGGYNPISKQVVKRSGEISQIKTISYPNDVTIYFVYDSTKNRCDYGSEYNTQGSMALREIRVASGGNCTRYQMVQSYAVTKYGSNTTIDELAYGSNCVSVSYMPSNRMHRLKLNGINLLSCDGSVTEPYYTFNYDATPLPLRFSGSQDWFGYFNGKVPVVLLNTTADPDMTIPYHSIGAESFGVDRSEDVTKMKAGILTQINNAYGGTVTFAYGGHDNMTNPLTLPANSNYFGTLANDGLRVNSVTESDIYHTGSFNKSIFTYSEGQRFLTGGYFHYPLAMADVGTVSSGNGTLTGTYVTPHQFIGGGNHGYSKVIVTRQNESGQLLSKKEIRFTNLQDSLSGNQPRYLRVGGGKHFYEFPFTDKQYMRDWEMGLPMYITTYDEYGNILEKTVNTYAFSIDSLSAVTKGVQGIKTSFVRDNTLPPITAAGPFSFTVPRAPVTDPYKPFNGEARLVNTTTYKYLSDNNFVTDQVKYEYDAYSNLKATTTFNSDGAEIKQINYYNYDLVTVVGTGAFAPLPGQQRLMSSQRWQRITNSVGVLPDNGLLLDAYFTGLGVTGSSNPNTAVWVRNQYQLQNLSPLTYSQYLGTGTYNTTAKKAWGVSEGQPLPFFKKISEVTTFDAKGNPLETQLGGQDQYKAMIWDTLTGNKLAEAANCRYADIAYSSFEGPDTYNSNLSVGAGAPASIGYPASEVSGRKCVSLWTQAIPGTAVSITGTRQLQAGKEYILSFWSTGTAPNIFIGFSPIGLPSPAYTKGIWKNYIVRFTPSAAAPFKLTGTATSTKVDEVRLYPSSATMQSSTYEPLFGQSSATDATGRITYYEYDKMGKQTLVRDQEGNIISRTQFTVRGNQ